MNLKKLTAVTIGAATLALGMGAAMPASADNAEIAIVLKTLSNPYWVSMKNGILAEAKKRGVTVDVLAGNSEDDIQGQQRLTEDVVNKNYKAIGLAPISPVSLIQSIVNANKKGIYVVNVDEKIDTTQLKAAGGSVVAFIATDNLALGKKAGAYIVSKLGAGGGKVAIIEGKAGNASGDARRDGATQAFKAASNVTLVASQPADASPRATSSAQRSAVPAGSSRASASTGAPARRRPESRSTPTSSAGSLRSVSI